MVVGVWCPLTIIMERRMATWQQDYGEDGQVPEPVKRWQTWVHQPGIYDLTLDTSEESVTECLRRIGERLNEPETLDACRRIALLDGQHGVEEQS
jgi:chloramphenicol 3-O phosphotransferase